VTAPEGPTTPWGTADLPEPLHPRHGQRVASVLAVVVVWVVLVVPDRLGDLGPAALLRLPVEGLFLAALLLLARPAAARGLALVAGVALAALTLIRVVDLGVRAALERPFDPLADLRHVGSAAGVLADSVGRSGAAVAVLGTMVLAGAVSLAVVSAVLRLSSLVRRRPGASRRVVATLSVAWVVIAVLGLQVSPAGPVAARSAATLAGAEVGEVRQGLLDRDRFAAALTPDPLAASAGPALLSALRGKDVLLVFVESYGRVALEDPGVSRKVVPALEAGTAELAAAGYTARSAYLTSPTFGGLSWLAHSTLQSGLRIDSQQRYDSLVESRRVTLTAAFGRAGWRTVCTVPANHDDWPEARSFYRCDEVYDARTIGYAGPSFGYAPVPDQFTLEAFRRAELEPTSRRPVMAEIDLVSSHAPWAPLPRLLDPDVLGDGTVYAGTPAQGTQREVAWRSPDGARTAYAQSLIYSLQSLISFVTTARGDRGVVLVVLGDHQPSAPVTGPGAGRDVPVTVIADDPAVLDRISGWAWALGMLPVPTGPVWPMEAFRERLLDAWSVEPTGAPPPAPGLARPPR
jgi:hypothetical protein